VQQEWIRVGPKLGHDERHPMVPPPGLAQVSDNYANNLTQKARTLMTKDLPGAIPDIVIARLDEAIEALQKRPRGRHECIPGVCIERSPQDSPVGGWAAQKNCRQPSVPKLPVSQDQS
jgi:hypothetical protein